jgi:hypothetical protein
MANPISEAVKGGHGTGVLYAGMLGLALSDAIPTPADALYFYRQQKLRERFEKGEISPKTYWVDETLGYYGYNVAWWLLLFGVVSMVKGDFRKKMELAVGLVAAGAVVGVIGRNIRKDVELQKKLKYTPNEQLRSSILEEPK